MCRGIFNYAKRLWMEPPFRNGGYVFCVKGCPYRRWHKEGVVYKVYDNFWGYQRKYFFVRVYNNELAGSVSVDSCYFRKAVKTEILKAKLLRQV